MFPSCKKHYDNICSILDFALKNVDNKKELYNDCLIELTKVVETRAMPWSSISSHSWN